MALIKEKNIISPSEELVSAENVNPGEMAIDGLHLSATEELKRLTGGNFRGPIMAALPSVEHVNDPEFNLYGTVFGRDTLRVDLNVVNNHPELVRHNLLLLASSQGTEYDVYREEEPGRIAHEVRDPATDKIAQQLTRDRHWEWPYYGAVDTTPEYIRTLTAYCKAGPNNYEILGQVFTDKDGHERKVINALDASVEWITRRMDDNPEGLLEYKPAFLGSIENQVWRDSWDSFSRADGSLANTNQGIASLDVQRAAMDALLDAADIYEYNNQAYRTGELRARASQLKKMIIDKFWVDKGGFFAIGTDRDGAGYLRQLDVCSSDMGHVLHSSLLDDNAELRDLVVKRLFQRDMLSQNGIRTLSSNEVRFRPGAYHNGSVWAWDNYLIAQGLQKHGYFLLANVINKVLLDGVAATNRFPEFWRGDLDDQPPYQLNTQKVVVWDEKYQRANTVEQPPQDIQAWTVGAIYAIKASNGQKPKWVPQPLGVSIFNSLRQDSAHFQAITDGLEIPVIAA